MNEIQESEEVKEHTFWKAGGGFEWCFPRASFVRAADPITGFMWNRYPHNVIGVAVYVKGRGLSVRWKRSRRKGAV